jgi:tellurite methyltransferase
MSRVSRDDTASEARARWNARYADEAPETPAAALVRRAELLPRHGRALDVAGGAGRNALWLAARGLDVTLVDVSDTGCALARERAAAAGVPLDVLRLDLGVDPLPDGPFAVIVVLHYLDRVVWRALPGRLAPGGTAFYVQATVRNLERHARPPRRFLLDEGELERFVATLVEEDRALEVVELTEGWTVEDRHEALAVLGRRH